MPPSRAPGLPAPVWLRPVPVPAPGIHHPAYCRVVRHATPAGLERISDLLAKLRGVDGLVERTPGVFYRRSRAFLHFHEDPTGMFADVRLAGDDFVRLRVTSRAEQASLLRQVRRAVGEEAPTLSVEASGHAST